MSDNGIRFQLETACNVIAVYCLIATFSKQVICAPPASSSEVQYADILDHVFSVRDRITSATMVVASSKQRFTAPENAQWESEVHLWLDGDKLRNDLYLENVKERRSINCRGCLSPHSYMTLNMREPGWGVDYISSVKWYATQQDWHQGNSGDGARVAVLVDPRKIGMIAAPMSTAMSVMDYKAFLQPPEKRALRIKPVMWGDEDAILFRYLSGSNVIMGVVLPEKDHSIAFLGIIPFLEKESGVITENIAQRSGENFVSSAGERIDLDAEQLPDRSHFLRSVQLKIEKSGGDQGPMYYFPTEVSYQEFFAGQKTVEEFSRIDVVSFASPDKAAFGLSGWGLTPRVPIDKIEGGVKKEAVWEKQSNKITDVVFPIFPGKQASKDLEFPKPRGTVVPVLIIINIAVAIAAVAFLFRQLYRRYREGVK